MKVIVKLVFLIVYFISTANAQEVASYYFYNNFREFTNSFPDLTTTGQPGKFLTEVVPKLGQTPRQVYSFPTSSGLVFDYSKAPSFIQGSFTVEMYFRYDNASLLIYGMIIGEKSEARVGEYVHLVTTRDEATKRVNVFLDGKLKTSFIDSEDQLAIEPNAQFIFFTRDETETTSGAVAMIKIYNYFIDEQAAELLFEPFLLEKDFDKPTALNKKIVLERLYFVQSLPNILPESMPEMESLHDYLQANSDVRILLIGHTDNQGDFNLNLKLSQDRAESVKSFLVENGIDPKRIETKGYGSLRPIASNDSEQTRRLNRRVELEIME